MLTEYMRYKVKNDRKHISEKYHLSPIKKMDGMKENKNYKDSYLRKILQNFFFKLKGIVKRLVRNCI